MNLITDGVSHKMLLSGAFRDGLECSAVIKSGSCYSCLSKTQTSNDAIHLSTQDKSSESQITSDPSAVCTCNRFTAILLTTKELKITTGNKS